VTGPLALELRTTGADQTRSLAAAIAPLCAAGDVLLLAGDLGAGKTTFAHGFGAALGITEVMTSPTFTLVRRYELDPRAPGGGTGGTAPSGGTGAPGGAGAPGRPVDTLLHADMYRLDHLHEIVDLGLGELVEDGGVALVEWGEAAEPVLGEESLSVRLDPADDDDGHRLITLRTEGEGWTRRWETLESAVAAWRVES
jgi:tRNA threonylcarbamoyladenosine biosynthesis protein TsaE